MVSAHLNSGIPSTDAHEGDDYALPANYKPYVPVAKRRAQLLTSLQSKKVKTSEEIQREREEAKREEEDEERQKEKLRRERTLLQQAQEVKERKAAEGGERHAPKRFS